MMSNETSKGLRQPARRGGRPPKYPWNHWLDGERKLLSPGTHYSSATKLESLRAQILHEAQRRQLVVSTSLEYGGIVIDFLGARQDDIDWDSLWDGERHDLPIGFPPVYEPWELVAEVYKQAARRGISVDQIRVMAEPGSVAMRAILTESQREAVPTERVQT